MKYGYTIFYVEDVQKTLAFYEKAFGFEKKFITPENDYGELASGETTISFASIGLGKNNFKKGFNPVENGETPIGMEMAFITENIKEPLMKEPHYMKTS